MFGKLFLYLSCLGITFARSDPLLDEHDEITGEPDSDTIHILFDQVDDSHERFQRQKLRPVQIRHKENQTNIQGLTIRELQTESDLREELTKVQHRKRWERSAGVTRPTRTPPRRLTTYLNNKVTFLQRTVGSLAVSLKKAEEKVKSYEEWKASSEERFERLEAIVERLQRKTESADNDEVNAFFLNQGLEQPTVINNQDYRSGEGRVTTSRGNENISAPVTTSGKTGQHDRSPILSKRRLETTNFSANGQVWTYYDVAQVAVNLNASFPLYRKVIYKMYSSFGNFRRYAMRKHRSLERRIALTVNKTARDAEKRYSSLEKRVKILENQVESHQLSIHLIENDALAHRRQIVQVFKSTRDLIESHTNALNNTYSSKFQSLGSEMVSYEQTTKALSASLKEEINNNADIRSNIAKFQKEQRSINSSLLENLISLRRRVKEKERRFIQQFDLIKSSQNATDVQILSIKSTADQQKEELAILQRKINKIRTSSNENDSIIIAIKKNITALPSEIKALNDKLEGALASYDESKSQSDEAQEAVEGMKTKIKELDDKYDLCHMEVEAKLQPLRASITSCCEASTSVIASLNETFNDIQAQLDNITSEGVPSPQEVNLPHAYTRAEYEDRIANAEASITRMLEKIQPNISKIVNAMNADKREKKATERTNWNRREDKYNVTIKMEIRKLEDKFIALHTKLKNEMMEQRNKSRKECEKTIAEETEQVKSDIKYLNESTKSLKSEMFEKYMSREEYEDGTNQVAKRIEDNLLAAIALKHQLHRNDTEHLSNRLQRLEEASAVYSESHKLLLNITGGNSSTAQDRLIKTMRYDIDFNYNTTQLIIDYVKQQDERMSVLNDEIQTMGILNTTITDLEYTIEQSNDTISTNVHENKKTLDDFMSAFDTLNRVMERHTEEYEFMKKNVSDHLYHISTNLEYLTRIVRETNRAVDENQERIDEMNGTLLYVQLLLPHPYGAIPDNGFDDAVTLDSPGYYDDGLGLESPDEEDFQQPGSLSDNPNLDGDGQDEGSYADDVLLADDPNARQTKENLELGSLERRKRFVKGVRKINKKVSRMFTVIKSLQHSVKRIKNESKSLAATLPNFDQMSRKQAAAAFSVGLTATFHCCGTVKFNKIFSNKGGTYNAGTGRFTAEIAGLYAFFVTISERNSLVNAALVQNGMSHITIRMDHSMGHYEQSQSSNAVVLPVTAGDQVWLQIYSGSLKGYQSPSVTFSGFLIAG